MPTPKQMESKTLQGSPPIQDTMPALLQQPVYLRQEKYFEQVFSKDSVLKQCPNINNQENTFLISPLNSRISDEKYILQKEPFS